MQLSGNPAAAMSQGVVQLPELRPASDVGRKLWLSALAGSAPLGYLAQTVPTMPDRRLLLGLMWQTSVPMPRATWFVRLLYTHLARQQLRPLPPPPPLPVGGITAATAAAAGGGSGGNVMGFTSSASAMSAAAAAAAGVQAASSALASTRASLWTSDLLSYLDSQIAAVEAAAAAAAAAAAVAAPSGNGGNAAAATAAAPLSSPQIDYPAASPGVSSPDWPGLGADDAFRLQDPFTTGGTAAGAASDPRARLLDYHPGAAVLYFVRLAGSTFLDGLLDTAKLVDWACGQLAAVTSVLAGLPAASAPPPPAGMTAGAGQFLTTTAGAGGLPPPPPPLPSAAAAGVGAAAATTASGDSGRQLTAAEQLRAQVSLQLLLACLPDLTQSQSHVRKIVEASLELLMASRCTAASIGASSADAAPCLLPTTAIMGTAIVYTSSPPGPNSPPVATVSPPPPPPLGLGTMVGSTTAASATSFSRAAGGIPGGDLDPVVIQLSLECLEGCVRDAPAAVLSLDSLPMLVRALKAPWPSTAGTTSVAYSGSGSDAAALTAAVASTAGEVCARRRAIAEKLAAAHAALATSVNTRLLSFNPVAALRDLDRAAAAGDVDAGMRTLTQACGGDVSRPGCAVQLLGNWVVGLPIVTPAVLVPAAAAAVGMDDLAARADIADMGLPCRTVYACRLLVRLAAECRRSQADAAAASAQGLPPLPLATGANGGPAASAASTGGGGGVTTTACTTGVTQTVHRQGTGPGASTAQQPGTATPAHTATTAAGAIHGPRGGSAGGAVSIDFSTFVPVLQESIVSWLVSRPGPCNASGSGSGSGGGTAATDAAAAAAQMDCNLRSSPSGVTSLSASAAAPVGTAATALPPPPTPPCGWNSLNLRRTAQFLVAMTEVGVFSPVVFVQRLLVDGVFDPAPATAGLSEIPTAAVATPAEGLAGFPSSAPSVGGGSDSSCYSRAEAAALALYLQHLHPQLVAVMDEQAAAAAAAAVSTARPGGRRTLGGGVAALGQQQRTGGGSSGGATIFGTTAVGTEMGGAGPVSGHAYGRTRKSLLSMARYQGLFFRPTAAAADGRSDGFVGGRHKRQRRRLLGPGYGSGRDGPEGKRRRVTVGTPVGRGQPPQPQLPSAACSPAVTFPLGPPAGFQAAAVLPASPAAATPTAGTVTAGPDTFERVLAAAVRSLDSLTYMSLATTARGRSAGPSGRPPQRAPSPGAPASPGPAASPGLPVSSPSPSSSPLRLDGMEVEKGGSGSGSGAAAATTTAATGPRGRRPEDTAATTPLATRTRGGGRTGRGGEQDLMAEVRGLRPWQQRLIAAAVCRHVNAVLTAALLPIVSFGATAALLPFPSSYVRSCSAAVLSKPAELPGGPLPEAVAATRAGGGFSAVKHGDTWLLRCLALLEACQCWHCGPQLLLHLTALHVEATGQWATSLPSAATGGGAGSGAASTAAAAAAAALESGGLLWHRLRLQSSLVMSTLESMAPRLVACGLLLPALDFLTTWAIRYGAPAAPGRKYLGRATQCAGVLAAGGMTAEA
ncbi:hypothetical protein Vretifemale_3581, partial [Volvox reticuliferus]